MFFYLIHNLPWGSQLENGKRNVRTFLIGSVCYILLHALLYANTKNFIGIPMLSSFLYLAQRYFWWILLADSAAMSITYKLFYGRSILTELPLLGAFKGLFKKEENKEIIPTITNINIPKIDETKNINITPINNKEQSKVQTKNSNELEIDLLTENESIKPVISKINNIETIDSTNHTLDTSKQIKENNSNEIIINEPSNIKNDNKEIEQKNNQSENQQTSNSDISEINSSHSSTNSSGPKLTSENIDKYVINRKLKIKQSELDIRSEDLDL